MGSGVSGLGKLDRMDTRAILTAVGVAFLSASALMFAYMLASPVLMRPTPLTETSATAGSIGVAFYAQNLHFRARTELRIDRSAISLRATPKWVQRGFLVADRRPEACFHDGRGLHVFTLPTGTRTLYAVGFILDPRRNDITCSVVTADAPHLSDHPPTFAAADGLLLRGKLEYVAHPELRALPQAFYQPKDRPVIPVPPQ